MKKNQFLVGLGVAVIGLLFVFLLSSNLWAEYQYQGSVIEPAQAAFDFSLKRADGRSFSLSEQRGKVALIFFGYTNCPDVCPTTLSDFKRVHADLGEAAQDVAFVFITVDPERDTPEVIDLYAKAFKQCTHSLDILNIRDISKNHRLFG